MEPYMSSQVIIAALKEDFPTHDFDFVIKEEDKLSRKSKLTIDGKEVKVLVTHDKANDQYVAKDCVDPTDVSDKILYDVVIKNEVQRIFDSGELASS
jgi:hypothetical protein